MLLDTVTNADGRTDGRCWRAGELEVGEYELVFAVGRVLRRAAVPGPRARALRASPIPDAHYHVPLLVSPWSYSTYRGS